MELKLSIEHHDLEAAEALVSMSFWGQRLHVPRPLTPTSDSCDSIHLQPEAGDVAKDLIALTSLVRNTFLIRSICSPFLHIQHVSIKYPSKIKIADQ